MSSLSRRSFLAQAGAVGLAAAMAGVPAALIDAAEADAAALRWPVLWTLELMNELRGGVVTQVDPKYAAAMAIYNSRFDLVFPQVIARPRDEADVVAAMRWAARHDIAIVPRGGGHGYTGNATTDRRGLVLDMRAMRGVAVSDQGRRADVGAGALAIDVIAALAPLGLAIPTGSCPSVGITGLASGGGIGSLTRQHGLTADRLESLRIVTPDGVVRTADAQTNPDLLWAHRGGGGGNIGVVTQLGFRTVEAVPETHIGIRWPWVAAEAALDAFLRTAPDAPDALSGDLAFSRDSAGQPPAVQYDGTFLGPEDQARAALAPLIAAAPGGVATFLPRTHLASALAAGQCTDLGPAACRPARFGAPGQLGRKRFFAGSAYLDRPLDAAGRGALLRSAVSSSPILNGTRSIIMAAHGGAVASVDPDATAFPHRDVHCSLQFYAVSSGAWEDGNARSWVRQARTNLAPHATGAAYVNYLDLDQTGWEQAYYGRSLERLKAIKARYDPNEMFRPQQGIPTA